MTKVLLVANHPTYVFTLRREILEKLIEQHYDVAICCPYGKEIEFFKDMGCTFYNSDLKRHGKNVFQELNLKRNYGKVIVSYKPDIILTFTIKPNLYAGMEAAKRNIPYIINITGLGTALEKESLLQKTLLKIYKYAIRRVSAIMFQNKENMDFFKNNKLSTENNILLPGSGVNVSQFSFEEYPTKNDKLSFLFIGRIMKDKGVEELFAAASNIKEKYPNVVFDAIGFCEEEYKERIETLKKEEIINFHGVKDNVQDYIKECNAVVHPTYHEGMSNVLLEASSMGRPILASNIPGCREIFDEGISGFGFKAKDSEDLTNTIEKFIKLPINKKESMGAAAREKVVNKFDREIVVNRYLNEIDKIVNKEKN
ncbi:MAG: glycosyltransferase family 4 protein [Lactococcus lactis]|nr:glycosyltransferase family 4 protein [Lactococcus lactis]